MRETRVNWVKKKKGGSTALRLMLRVLKKGQSVAFTADQPQDQINKQEDL